MVSFSGSLHFSGGSGQVMPEPQDRKRSCKPSIPAAHAALCPGHCRQLAGPKARRGQRRNTDAWTQPFFALLFRTEKESSPRSSSQRKAGPDFAPTWSWGTASSSHSGQRRRRPHSRTSGCACRTETHVTSLQARRREGQLLAHLRDEGVEFPATSG